MRSPMTDSGAALKVSELNGIKVYNCTAGKTTPEWLEEHKNKHVSLRYNEGRMFRMRNRFVAPLWVVRGTTSLHAVARLLHSPHLNHHSHDNNVAGVRSAAIRLPPAH